MTRWMGVTAVVLAACSGAHAHYATSVAPSQEFERPMIDARRCLETFGFDMKIIDFKAGLISGEKFELADDGSPGVVVSEISVISGNDSVKIIAHSRQASTTSQGWESVHLSRRVRRAVDQLADRLGGGPSGARVPCESFLPREGDDVARGSGSSPRGGLSPGTPSAMSTAVSGN